MNYSVFLVICAIANLVIGSSLIIMFQSNVGFAGLLVSSICMGIVFIKDVVNKL